MSLFSNCKPDCFSFFLECSWVVHSPGELDDRMERFSRGGKHESVTRPQDSTVFVKWVEIGVRVRRKGIPIPYTAQRALHLGYFIRGRFAQNSTLILYVETRFSLLKPCILPSLAFLLFIPLPCHLLFALKLPDTL